MDLAGLWRGEFSPRRAMVLAKHLPYGCQTWIAAGADGAWNPETHLLAHTVYLLEAANWQRGGGQGKEPKPLESPGEEKRSQERRERELARAARFKNRSAAKTIAPPDNPPPAEGRPRDSRGRFVSQKGE